MNDKNKLAYFMTKLASLMDEYEVTIDNTSEDDGIHFFCGKEDVAIISPTSDDLIKKAMFISSNIENELIAIKAKYYSLDSLKSEHEKSETKLITEKLPYHEGYEAYQARLNTESNPYPESSWRYKEWYLGWSSAEETDK